MRYATSPLTADNPVQDRSNALYAWTRNRKGNEYAGSRFQTPPRPERFKRYEGTYQRLKTSLLTPDQGDQPEPETVNLQLVERVLMMAYGITSVKFYGYQSEMVWTVPSAGACYPFEVYLVVRHVEGMRPGVYYYSAISTSLFYISGNENIYLLNQSLLPEDTDADFYIVSTIIPWRSCWKYSNRGYRFSYIDTGHLLCNFQAVTKALKLSSTTYTQLRTDYVRSLLHTDESEEAVSIICVKRDKGQAAPHERACQQEQVSYCRHLRELDCNEASFDWSDIRLLRQQMNEAAGEPNASWIHPFRMKNAWDEADKLGPLLFQRRSCSAFLRSSISEGQFNPIASIIEDYKDAITCYAVVHGVEHLEPGLYRFDGRSMVLLQPGDFRKQSTELCLDQPFVYNSAILLFLAVNLDSIRHLPAWTQRQRLIDAGSLSQLLYLKCEEIGLGYSAIGGYYDTEARELFGEEENVEFVYAGVLGKEDRNANFQIKVDRYYLNKPKTDKQNASLHKGGVRVILDRLEESASSYADHPAIIYDGVSYTYREMLEQIGVYGQQAAAAITNRYPVGICMKNHPNYLFVYYGLLKHGFIPMLIDSTFTMEEIRTIKESYHLGSLITMDSNGVIRYEIYEDEHLDYDPDAFIDVAVCRFSSGTTGKPKCLMFTSEAIMSAAANWKTATGITPEDKVLCTALFHNGLAFNTSLLSVFLSGACLIIHRNISPKSIWELLIRHEATILVAFPVVFDMLNKSQYLGHDHPMRLCVSSSAPLHYNIKQLFEEQTGIKICDYYGIVEAGPATFNDGTVPDSLGKPIEGVQIRIVDEGGREVVDDETGTLQIRTASMAKGYYNYSSSYASMVTPDGYYQTTDRGFIRNGYLYIVGRNSEMINVAGKKLDPTEVENSILSMEGVEDAAVIGISNQSLTSEYPVAFVVCTPDVTSQAVVHHCQEKLAPYKHPQKVIRIASIPRSGVGKVKRRELVDLYYSMHSEQERVK